MERDKASDDLGFIQQPDTRERSCSAAPDVVSANMAPESSISTPNSPFLGHAANPDGRRICDLAGDSGVGQDALVVPVSTPLAVFVEQKFIPEYVSIKTSAGRAHFQSILKHVLTPELVNRAFGVNAHSSKIKCKSTQDWPYMDSLQLSEVRTEDIRHLMSTALDHGYSTQTVMHIRNVLRAVFSHASKTSFFSGPNPAALVIPPSVIRREAHALTLDEWTRVIRLMRYPEREIALLATVTGMSVAEICGLQWKFVNFLPFRHLVNRGWIPARSIAIRNQSYRGEFGPVMESRKRIVFAPELMFSVLQALRTHASLTGPDDFVVTSRSGTPVNQDNLAERRLKSIGESAEMPWLSWQVFRRTHLLLSAEFGRKLESEVKKVLESM